MGSISPFKLCQIFSKEIEDEIISFIKFITHSFFQGITSPSKLIHHLAYASVIFFNININWILFPFLQINENYSKKLVKKIKLK